ncbi:MULTISPECIES: AAA family ATPase [unclassified Streptomyces]|uniref:AAA family ATPase n=1 Tax=unclassified Streptomyces TaxID=2593676 RepID=UPI002E2DF427|nr:AAA family ATPase [Streptomyces sp. NBC_00223]
MRRYVPTGTPGAGKTSILRCLAQLSYGVLKEAATAVIAQAQAGGEDKPWMRATFIDDIVALQREPQVAATNPVTVFDRSPICAHALATYLRWPSPPHWPPNSNGSPFERDLRALLRETSPDNRFAECLLATEIKSWRKPRG